MNTNITKEQLTVWVAGIMECAKQDSEEKVWWFVPTLKTPFAIVAGWKKMFDNGDFSDIFCCSKSNPERVMCLSVVSSNSFPATDFESIAIPRSIFGAEEDVCIPLEWEDSPEVAADFFLMEWERITKENSEAT